jgi:hypothetical protein
MKDNLKEILLAVFISIIFFLLMALVLRKLSPVEEEDLASRIISIESGSVDGYYNYKIIADRETDVEYLIIQKAGDGIGVTVMRDSGGTVLRRE